MSLSEPFSVEEARELGISRAQLLGKRWRRLGLRIYASLAVADDPLVKLQAAMHRLPAGAVFSGRTAAWFHSLINQLTGAIEATVPLLCATSRLVGITIRRARLEAGEVVVRRGFRVTCALEP